MGFCSKCIFFSMAIILAGLSLGIIINGFVNTVISSPAYKALIAMNFFLVLLIFMGVIGMCIEHKNLVRIYAVIAGLLFAIVTILFAVIIAALLSDPVGRSEENVKKYIEKNGEDDFNEHLDIDQKLFDCCGYDGPKYYKDIYEKDKKKDPVPLSCCNLGYENAKEECFKAAIDVFGGVEKETKYLKYKSCYDQVKETTPFQLGVIGALYGLSAVVVLGSIISALCAVSDFNKLEMAYYSPRGPPVTY